MKNLKREEAFKFWDQCWNELQEEWFKIEVLQDYTGEDHRQSLKAWLAGDKDKSIALMVGEMKEWIEMCKKSNAVKRRYHVVKEPYTPYLEWEIELYKRVNIPLAGEDVYLVPAKKVSHLSIPDGDVMIFDSKKVVRNHYNSKGFCESMDFYLGGEDDIAAFLGLRQAIQKYASQVM